MIHNRPATRQKAFEMGANEPAGPHMDIAQDFVAELAQAAYAVALRHGVNDGWLDLELDIWQALAETVNSSNQQEIPRRFHRK